MTDRFATHVLTDVECWELVERTAVGRLAVCLNGSPHIFPINFVRDGSSIVFRTAPGTKLSAARHSQVAFEIDGYEPEHSTAWSVIVAGAASEIDSSADLFTAQHLALFPWHVAPKAHFVRVVAAEVSGRRFHAPYAGPSGFQHEAPPERDR